MPGMITMRSLFLALSTASWIESKLHFASSRSFNSMKRSAFFGPMNLRLEFERSL